jgi:hypothetical protein
MDIRSGQISGSCLTAASIRGYRTGAGSVSPPTAQSHRLVRFDALVGAKEGSRCDAGAAPATVTGDEGENRHWAMPGKASPEDDPEARRPAVRNR